MAVRGLITRFNVVLMLVTPLMVWAAAVGDPRIYFAYDTPPGQGLYVLSKLAALYAVAMLGCQVIAGLIRPFIAARCKDLNFAMFHRTLGISTIVTVVLHVGLFVAAVSLRKGHFASGLLLPNFTDFYSTAVSLGLFALFALFFVGIAGAMRTRAVPTARWIHWLATPALALAMIHSLQIGSETRDVLVIGFYIVLGACIAGGVAYKLRNGGKVLASSRSIPGQCVSDARLSRTVD